MRVAVHPYDPQWRSDFERVRQRLQSALTDVAVLAVEHVGSTSVPGLPAKPIIDVDVVIPPGSLPAAVFALTAAGYDYQGERGVPGRHAMGAPDDDPPRHVYVCLDGSLALRNHLLVRDTLRSNAALRDEYSRVKTDLADQDLEDIDAYVAAKSAVLQKVLAAGGFSSEDLQDVARANPRFWTRARLRLDLQRLGLRPGQTVMAHAALSRVGRMLNGPDALIGAVLDAVSPGGTLVAYTDWDARYDKLLDSDGRVPREWREHVPPFDAAASRAARDNGALPEFLRTWPGAVRSGSPGASVAAVGAQAEWLTADHPLDYGYGEGSPLAKLVALGGYVLMVGAPLDTMTLLHHAEHVARIPGKRTIRYEVPLSGSAGVEWRTVEEFDTAVPVVDGLPDDYFATVVEDFLATGQGVRGDVGQAPCVLVDAAAISAFAVAWLEERCG